MKRSLEQWLRWQEGLHPATIELGLERVGRVHEVLVSEPVRWPVVSVAGTNGKGSSVAMLESIYRHAGYRTAAYTSPHLWRYNERLRLNGVAIGDAALCAAFERVEAARGDVPLTYFEFGTLAVFDLIARFGPDVALLEVGLGGRLDAVNVQSADVALITSIGLDHQDWLGPDREAIGYEKAGIMRARRPVVFGGADMPESVGRRAVEVGAVLYRAGRDFSVRETDTGWRFAAADGNAIDFPEPGLVGRHQRDNAAAVVMVTRCLAERLPLTPVSLATGLRQARVSGRMQTVTGQGPAAVPVILDVAHNPDATAALAAALAADPVPGVTLAVVGVLADKSLDAILQPLLPLISRWYCTDLPMTPRGLSAAALKAALEYAGAADEPVCHAEPAIALAAAIAAGERGDRVLVFGSFYTVAAATAIPDSGRTLSDS